MPFSGPTSPLSFSVDRFPSPAAEPPRAAKQAKKKRDGLLPLRSEIDSYELYERDPFGYRPDYRATVLDMADLYEYTVND